MNLNLCIPRPQKIQSYPSPLNHINHKYDVNNYKTIFNYLLRITVRTVKKSLIDGILYDESVPLSSILRIASLPLQAYKQYSNNNAISSSIKKILFILTAYVIISCLNLYTLLKM